MVDDDENNNPGLPLDEGFEVDSVVSKIYDPCLYQKKAKNASGSIVCLDMYAV